MKRLDPLALLAEGTEKVVLRCAPRFDLLDKKTSREDLIVSMRSRAVDGQANEADVIADFPFTWSETAILQDRQFQFLTCDDYSEMWMTRAADYLAAANDRGVKVTEVLGGDAQVNAIFVQEGSDPKRREYRVAFTQTAGEASVEFVFVITGGANGVGNVGWDCGAYEASWVPHKRTWEIDGAEPEGLEFLVQSLLQLDTAIHSELIP